MIIRWIKLRWHHNSSLISHPKTKSSRDELESFYRGDMSVYMFVCLMPGFAWMIILQHDVRGHDHIKLTQTGKTGPRVGLINNILSEHVFSTWLHLIIDTSSFLEEENAESAPYLVFFILQNHKKMGGIPLLQMLKWIRIPAYPLFSFCH